MIGEQINGVVQQLERLPRTLTDVSSDLEIFSVTLGTLFEQTGEQAKNLLNADEIEKQVRDATEGAQSALDRALENMSNATANHERDLGTSWSRIAEHYQDAAKQTALATQQMSDHTEDFTRRSARSLEDLNTKLDNIGTKDRNPFEGLAEAFDETMLRIQQSFDRHMRELSASHTDRLSVLSDNAAKAANSMDTKIADAANKAAEATKEAIAQHAIAIDNIFHSVERENENFAANIQTRNQKLGNSIRDAGEQHVETMKGYAERAAEVVEKTTDAVSRVNERLAEQMGALRARQLDETIRFSEQMQKISEDAAASQEKNAENLQKVMDLQEERVNALADSAASHSDRLESIRQQEANSVAHDSLRLRQIDREAKTLEPGDTKGAARLEEERTKIREEAELRKQEQEQAEAEENKRYAEEQKKLQDRYSKEMAALQIKNAQEKEANDKKEQQATIAAVKEHARNEAALQDAVSKAQHQAAIETQRIQITEGFQLASINRQQEAENLRFAISMRRIKEQYDMEVAQANRAHQQKLDDLSRALAAEDARYAAQLAKIKRDEEEKTKKAKEEADKREQEIAKQVERENAHFDRQRKEAESKRDEDESAAERRLQRQLGKADEVANRQVAAAERQTAAANRAYERQQEDLATKYDREVRDNGEAQDKIEARRDRAVEHELQSQQKMQDSFDQHLVKLQAKVDDLQKKLESAQDSAREGIEASQRIAQTEFNEGWVERANELEEVFDRIQGHAEDAFRWKVPDGNLTEMEKYKDQVGQVQEYLLEFDRRSVADLDTIQKAYFTLRTAGVDPVTMSLDKLQGKGKDANISLLGMATTLEALPQGHNQIDMIDRALTSLATGSIQNVQRELNRFGIRLDQITTEVDGKTVNILNKNHQLNTAMGITAQQATQAVLYHISQLTDGIQQNLVGTYAQITSSFKTMRIIFERDAGGAFFGGLKDQLRDLSEYLNTTKVKGQVKEIATLIGTEIGGMITAIATAFRHLDDLADDPSYRLIDYVGNIFSSLGRLKDSIIAVLGDIWNAFFPTMLAGKSPSDALAAIGDTIDGIAVAVRSAGPAIAEFAKSFAEGLMMVGKWIMDNKDDIIKAAEGIFNSFIETGKWLVDNGPAIGDVLKNIDEIIRELIKFLKENPDTIKNIVLGLAGFAALGGIVSTINSAVVAIGALFAAGTLLGGLLGVFKINIPFISAAFSGLFTAITSGGGLGAALSRVSTELGILLTHIGAIIASRGPVQSFFVGIASWASGALGAVGGLANAIAGVAVQAGRLAGLIPRAPVPAPPPVPPVQLPLPFPPVGFPATPGTQLPLFPPSAPPPTGAAALAQNAQQAAGSIANAVRQGISNIQGQGSTIVQLIRGTSAIQQATQAQQSTQVAAQVTQAVQSLEQNQRAVQQAITATATEANRRLAAEAISGARSIINAMNPAGAMTDWSKIGQLPEFTRQMSRQLDAQSAAQAAAQMETQAAQVAQQASQPIERARALMQQLRVDGRTIGTALVENFRDIGQAAQSGFTQTLAAARNFGNYITSGGLLRSWYDLETSISRLPSVVGPQLRTFFSNLSSGGTVLESIATSAQGMNNRVAVSFNDLNSRVAASFNSVNVRSAVSFTEMSRNFANAVQNIAAEAQNTTARIGPGFENMTTRVITALRELPANTIAAFRNIPASAATLYENIAVGAQNMNNRVAASFDAVNSRSAANFNNINRNFAAAVENMSANAQTMYARIGPGFENLTARAVAAFRNIPASAASVYENIAIGAQNMNSRVAASFNNLNGNSAASFNALNGRVAAVFNNVNAGLINFAENTAATFRGFGAAINSAVLQLGIIYERIRLLSLSGIYQSIEAGWTSVSTAITGAYNSLRQASPLFAAAAAAITGAYEAAATFATGLSAVGASLAIAAAALGAAIGLSVAWSFDIGNTRENLNLFLSWLKTQLPEGIRNAIDAAKAVIATWAAPFGALLIKVRDDLTRITEEVKNWVINILPDPLRGIAPAFINAINTAVTAALPEWMRNLKRIAGSGVVSEWTDSVLPGVLIGGLMRAFTSGIVPAAGYLVGQFQAMFTKINAESDKGMSELTARLSGDASKTTVSMYQEFDSLVPKLDTIWSRLHEASVEELSATQGDLQSIFIRLRYESGAEAEALRNTVGAKIAALAAEMKARSGEGTAAVSSNFAAMGSDVERTTDGLTKKVGTGAVTLSDTLNKMATDANSVSVPRMSGALHQLRVAFASLEDSTEDGAEEMRVTISKEIGLLATEIAKRTGDINVNTSTDFKAGADAGITEADRLNTSVSTLMAAMATSAASSTADVANSMRAMGESMESAATRAEQQAAIIEAAAARSEAAAARASGTSAAESTGFGSAPMPDSGSATNPGIAAALTGSFGGGGFGLGGNNFGAFSLADAMSPDYASMAGNASSFADAAGLPSNSSNSFAAVSDTMPMGNSSFGGLSSGASGGSTGSLGDTKLEISSLVKDMGEAITASPALARILGTAGAGAIYTPSGEASVGDLDRYIGSSLAAWSNSGGSMGRQNMTSEFSDAARQVPPMPNVGPLSVPTKSTGNEATGPTSGGGGGGGAPQPPATPKPPDPGGKPPAKPEEPPLPRDEPDRNVTINNQFGTFNVIGSSPEFIDKFVTHQIELFNAASVSAAT